MTELDFQKKLFSLIERLKLGEIDHDGFMKLAQSLAREYDTPRYKAIGDFEDSELGWAKYWIEEMSAYGVDRVFEHHFDFFQFFEERSIK